MAIVEEREAQHRRDMIGFLDKDIPGPPEAVAGGLFDKIMAQIETDPVLNIVLANGGYPHLQRELGKHLARGQRADIEFAGEAAQLWSRGGTVASCRATTCWHCSRSCWRWPRSGRTWRPTSTARRSPCCAASSSPALTETPHDPRRGPAIHLSRARQRQRSIGSPSCRGRRSLRPARPLGAGKSTTQRILMGLLRGFPDRMEFFGQPIAGHSAVSSTSASVSASSSRALPAADRARKPGLFAAFYSKDLHDPMEVLAEIWNSRSTARVE